METWMEIGGQPLTKFGAGCALALLCGLGMCFLRMKPGKGRYGRWIRLCVCVIPMAWFFARLFYALGDWIMIVLEGFFDLNTGRDPLNGFRFWLGGYSLVGGVTGAALGALPAAKWTGKADDEAQGALAFGLPVGILVERLMEHGTGLGLGRYVSSPALIATGFFPEAGGDFVHPVYLYEAAAAVILLAVTALLSRRKERSGSWLLQTFLVLFGLTQVLLESLRADGHMLEHFVHLQQVYAILLAAGVILGWTVRGRERKTWQKLAGWAGILVAAGVGIWAEFGVDRWGNPLLAYGLMTASMIVIGGIGHWLRGKEKAAA